MVAKNLLWLFLVKLSVNIKYKHKIIVSLV